MSGILIAYLAESTLEWRFQAGLAALGLWEYAITFPAEVEFVWKARLTTAILPGLFLCTRWWMLVNALVTLVGVSGIQATYTEAYVYYAFTLCFNLLGLAILFLFSALRVSAIWNRSMAVFLMTATLGMLAIALNIARGSQTVALLDIGSSYTVFSKNSVHTDYIYMVAITTSRVIADIFVLVLTWLKTYRQVLEARRFGFSVGISTCLLRDGTIYFLCLVTHEVVALVLYRTILGSMSSIILGSIPQIIVNRFIINLRRAGSSTVTTHSETPNTTAVHFQISQNAVTDLARPLDHGYDDEVPVTDEDAKDVSAWDAQTANGKPMVDDSCPTTLRWSEVPWGHDDVDAFLHPDNVP